MISFCTSHPDACASEDMSSCPLSAKKSSPAAQQHTYISDGFRQFEGIRTQEQELLCHIGPYYQTLGRDPAISM